MKSLSSIILPLFQERFPNRGMAIGVPPRPIAFFPGIHHGIRGVSIHDDGSELTVAVDDLTHGHFAEYDSGLSESERAVRIVDAVVDFLEALFADRVVVWGDANA